MSRINKPLGKAKISNIPTLPRISEVDIVSEISHNLTVLVVAPPDGGFAWVIVAAIFVNNFLIDGIVYSFGLLMASMATKMRVSLAEVALIGSVQVGVFYLSGPFVCVAVQHFGFRKTAVFGAILSSTAIFSASWCKDYMAVLLLYGMLSGLGNGILSSPSVIIVGYYFEKYRAIASGLALCGSSAGIIVLSPVFSECILRLGLEATLRIQAGMIACCGILSLTFRSVDPAKLTVEEDDHDIEPCQLDACADAISETSSQLEFRCMFGNGPVKVTDLNLKHSTTANNSSSVQQEQFSVVSRRTISMKTFRSRYASIYCEQEPSSRAPEMHCCCCVCCQSKPPANQSNINRTISFRTGPLNRQDIFYSGSLTRMSSFNNDIKFRPDLQIEKQTEIAPNGKCHITIKPLVNLLRMLIDVSLLKSPTYGVISLALFLFVFGLFTPYVYLAKRSREAGISEDVTKWLVSLLSVGNLLGRLIAGFVCFFPRIDPSKLVAWTTMAGAILSMITAFSLTKIGFVQVGFAMIWGFLVAFNPPLRTIIFVKYLGIDRLTNAFGLSMLVMGIAAIAGSPTAGVLIEIDGTYTYAFALSGGCHFVSGMVFLALSYVHKREIKQNKISRKP